MSLSSLLYVICLIVFLGLYWLLPDKTRVIWILAASVAFCIYSMPGQTLALVIYVLIIYVIGLAAKKGSKLWTAVTVILSVGFLFIYKFDGFSLAAPIGISYVTFQCIAYIVDIYRGNTTGEKDALTFFTYNLFFAKLTAGPIERPKEFMDRLKAPKVMGWKRASDGIILIAMGFLKKIAVADVLSSGVAAVYGNAGGQSGWAAVLASVMYAVQILFDFSGYTDIARGSAKLMGLELTENFNHPYMAVSIRDFWRRWHISLSGWLRDYVYFPMGGSKVGTIRRYLNVMVTFLVSGLWHGLSWNFIIWGILHGAFQVAGLMLEPAGKSIRGALHIKDGNKVYAWLCRVRTFVLITLTWVFFRAATLKDALDILGSPFRGMGSFGDALGLCGLDAGTVLLVVFAILAAYLMGRMTGKGMNRYGVILVAAAVMIIVLTVYSTTFGTASPFIYFDF